MRKGFSLIDVFVIIAIMALLIAILLAALGRAREASKRTACASKLLLHMIELIEWKTDEDSKKCGTYAIRFFSEAVEDRTDLWAMEWYSEGAETKQGPAAADPLLRPSDLIRTEPMLTPLAQPRTQTNRAEIDIENETLDAGLLRFRDVRLCLFCVVFLDNSACGGT